MRNTISTRARLFLVTFDLIYPVPGDHRYRDVDRYLGRIGQVMRPNKQTRLVITNISSHQMLADIRARTGVRCGVTVLRVSRRSSVYVHDPVMCRTVRSAIRQYGSP